ncbi:early endosome antigen 1-like isoform X2 [Heptranchias perlo]
MDTSEELPKKVFKARKTMRASDRQQLEAIYKSKEELLKANEETKTKLCNGRHENGDSDSKASLNTNCMDDTDIDSINDVRLGPEELQGNPIDELTITQTSELSFAEKCLSEDKDLSPQDEKMDSIPAVAEDEQISTGSAENQVFVDVESKRDDTVESQSVELKQDSLIADKSCTDSQSLSEEEKTHSDGDSRSQEVPDESSLKLQSSSSSVREKEDHESSLDISEVAITSSIESVQEKNDCESSKMECAETESEIVTKDKLSESKSVGNSQLEIEEIIPILEKLAPEKDNELSNKQEIVPTVDSPAPKDSPLKDMQEEQMDASPSSSQTKEECNGNLPEEAFLVLSDEDEPEIEKKTESEELVPKNESPDADHKEQAADTRQKQESNEVMPRKRSKSEDMESSISKRCRFSGDEYEAALKVKITARGEIRQTLEKIVQQIIEERISSMQSAVFDKKLAELKNRVEKIECNTRHESLINGLQAKLMQIEKRLGSANQARNDSALKKAQEIPAPFQPEMQFDLSSKEKFKLAKKNEKHQFGKPTVETEQVPLHNSRISWNTCSQPAVEKRGVLFQDNRMVYITFHKPVTKKRQSSLHSRAPPDMLAKPVAKKQPIMLQGNKIVYNTFDTPITKKQAALQEALAPSDCVEAVPEKQEAVLRDCRFSDASDKPVTLKQQTPLQHNRSLHKSAVGKQQITLHNKFAKTILKHKVPLQDCRILSGKPVILKQQAPMQHNGILSNAFVGSFGDEQQVALQDNRSGKPLIKREVPLQDCRASAESGKAVILKQQAVLQYDRTLSIKHKSTADEQQVALIDNQTRCNSFGDTILKQHEASLKISRTSKSMSVQLSTEKQQVYDGMLVKQKQVLLQEGNSPMNTSRKPGTEQQHVILHESKTPCIVLGESDVGKPRVIFQENKTPCNTFGETTAENQRTVLQESRTPYNAFDEPAVEQQVPLPDNKAPKDICEPVPDNRKRVIIQDSIIPYNTKRATAWGVRAWDEWAKNRNNYLMENSMKCDESFLYVPILSHEITHDELNFWLCHFVEEVRRQDGSFYPPNSLRLLCCSILRYLRETCKRLDIDFFNKYNVEYTEFRTVLDRRMKQLKQQGIGTVRKQAQPYTEEEEEKLWQIVFQLRDAKSYSYAVYFYLCKVFGVHAAAEHNKLVVDQFIFGADEIGEYLEFVAKPYRDGIQRTKGHTRQYADLSNPRCIVSLFRRYLSMVPSDGPFYRRPLPGRLEFCQQAIGVHTLERYSKEICEAGDISGRHTGQSGRVSSVAALHSRGFDEELIKERMGNGSNAMMSYKKTQMKAVSDCLQPPNPLKKISACSQSSSSLRQQSVCAQEAMNIVTQPEAVVTNQEGLVKVELPCSTPSTLPMSSVKVAATPSYCAAKILQ